MSRVQENYVNRAPKRTHLFFLVALVPCFQVAGAYNPGAGTGPDTYLWRCLELAPLLLVSHGHIY